MGIRPFIKTQLSGTWLINRQIPCLLRLNCFPLHCCSMGPHQCLSETMTLLFDAIVGNVFTFSSISFNRCTTWARGLALFWTKFFNICKWFSKWKTLKDSNFLRHLVYVFSYKHWTIWIYIYTYESIQREILRTKCISKSSQ